MNNNVLIQNMLLCMNGESVTVSYAKSDSVFYGKLNSREDGWWYIANTGVRFLSSYVSKITIEIGDNDNFEPYNNVYIEIYP